MRQKDIFFNCVIDKKKLKGATTLFFRIYGGSFVIEMLETLKKLGFHHATKAGSSIGIDDLLTPPTKANLVLNAELDSEWSKIHESLGLVTQPEEFQYGTKLWQKVNEALKQKVVDYFCSTDLLNPVYMMAFSGARGNISQVRQLVGMRGLIADPKGDLIDFPIKSNFREGLTLTEYLISCFGARKGVVDTALRTATAGYLTRRLVDVSHHIAVLHSDCFTKEGIVLKPLLNNEKTVISLYERLVGRVLAEALKVKDLSHSNQSNSFSFKFQKRTRSKLYPNLKTRLNLGINQPISYETATFIVNNKEKVLVRSPLTCQSVNSVCRLCYGWGLANGRIVNLGEAVGVIAGQSIGEPGTQLTMRTFHTGGIFYGQFFEHVMQAPCSGKIEFLTPMVGSLTRTVYGQLAFLLKEPTFIKICPLKDKPIKIQISKKNLLVVKEGQVVSTGQTIAEFATLTFSESAEKKLVRVQRDGTISTSTSFNYYQQTKDSVDLLENPFQLLPGQVLNTKRTNFIDSSDVVGSNTLINLLRLVGRGVGFVALAIHMKNTRQISQKEGRGAQQHDQLKRVRLTKKVGIFNRYEGPTNRAPIVTFFKNELVDLKHTSPLLNIVFQRVEYHKFGYLFFGNLHNSKTSNFATPLEVVLKNSLTQNFFSYLHYAKTIPWFQIFFHTAGFSGVEASKWCDFLYLDSLLKGGEFLTLVEHWDQFNSSLMERFDLYKNKKTDLNLGFDKKDLLFNVKTKKDLITWQKDLPSLKKKQQKTNNLMIARLFDIKRFFNQLSKQGNFKILNRKSFFFNPPFYQDRDLGFFSNRQPFFLGHFQNWSIYFQNIDQPNLFWLKINYLKRVEKSGLFFLKLFHPLFGRIVRRPIVCFSSPLPLSHQFFWSKNGFKLPRVVTLLVTTNLISFLPLWITTFWIDPSFNSKQKKKIFSLVLSTSNTNTILMSCSFPFVTKWRSFRSSWVKCSSKKPLFLNLALLKKKPLSWFNSTQKQNFLEKNSLKSFSLVNNKNFSPSKVATFLSGYKQGWVFLVTKDVVFTPNNRVFVRIGQSFLYPHLGYKQDWKKENQEKHAVFGNQHVILDYLYQTKNNIEVCKNKKKGDGQFSFLLNVFFSQSNCNLNLHPFQFCLKNVNTWVFQKKSQSVLPRELVKKQSHANKLTTGFLTNRRVFIFAQIGSAASCRWHPSFKKREWLFSRLYTSNQDNYSYSNRSLCFWHFKENKDFPQSWYLSQPTCKPLLVLARKVRPRPKRFFDCLKTESSKVTIVNLYGSIKQQVSSLEEKVCNLSRSVSLKNLLIDEKWQDYTTLQQRLFFGGQVFSLQTTISTLQVISVITVDYIRLNDFVFQLSELPVSFLVTVFVFTTAKKKETSIQMAYQSRLAPYKPLLSNFVTTDNEKGKFRLTGRGIASFALISQSNLPLILSAIRQSNSTIVQINSHNRTELIKGYFFPKGEILVVGSPSTKRLILTQAEQTALTGIGSVSPSFLGDVLRRGQKIKQQLALATEGVIVRLENNLTVIHETEGIPLGGSSNLKTIGGKTIQTGDPMIDFTIERHKTEDIIQGIPKIEELFEGRSEAEALFLKFELDFISQEDQQHYPDLKSLKRSYRRIQLMVVENIQQIYVSQGVAISDKHLEIVVKQMTLTVSMFNGNNLFGKLRPVTVSLVQFSKSFFLGLGIKRHIVRQWFREKALNRLVYLEKRNQKGNCYKSITAVLAPSWGGQMSQGFAFKRNNRRLRYRVNQKHKRPIISFFPLKKRVFKSDHFSFIKLWESTHRNETFPFFIQKKKIVDDYKKLGNQKRCLKPCSVRWVCAPLLMGITKSALSNTSLLAAASFQQTVLILTHSASAGRIDFLRGIKERGAIGEQMRSGTGQIANFLVKKKILSNIKSDSKKMIYDWVSLYLKNEKAAFFFKQNVINNLKFLTLLEPLKDLVSANNSKLI